MSTPQPTLAPAPRAVTVDELCEHLTRLGRGDTPLLCEFARAFFAKAPRHLLEARGPDQLAAMTLGAWEFLRRARPDQVNVQVVNPEEEGWSAGVTVVRAEVGDRPFIVDTIREYLGGEDLPIHHYVYPVLRVRRDGAGEIVEIGGEGGLLEALTHAEVSRVLDPARRQAIRDEVARSLGDVVEATSDFDAMTAQAEANARLVEGYAERFPGRAEEFQEQARFLRWLTDGNFVFLGYREYAVLGEGELETISVAPGSGLGILRDTSTSAYQSPVPVRQMDPDLRGRLMEGPALTVAKSNREATVHRRVRMDYVGVKTLDAQGRVRGERRFLGLFTSQAYDSGTGDVPIVRGKLARVLERSGARPGGHDYKEIVTLLDTMPKEELFQASVEQLGEQVQAALDSLFTEEVRAVVRADRARGEASVMVILPRGRYSVESRDAVGARLAQSLGGEVVDHFTALDGDRARVHFYLSVADGAQVPAARELEREVTAIVRTWQDRLRDALGEMMDEAEAARLADTYGLSFSPEYRAANAPTAAVHDVLHMEALERSGDAMGLNLRQPLPGESAPAGCSVLKLYLRGERLVLSDFMPILEDARMRVVEVDTFTLQGAGEQGFIIYSFAVQTREGAPIPDDLAPLLAESLLAVRAGDAVEDPFNGLTLAAGLRWREADLLRAYSEYAFQVGAIPSRIAVSRALAAYPAVTRLLIELFHARFAGQGGDQAEVRGRLMAEIEKVTALPDDRALRRLLALIEGTVRTNYYRHGGAAPTARSGGAPYMSFKVRCADVDELKKTRLLYEVFVHSSRMEAVHLRGAAVARGGIRWSDRPDDFRTEILGLVTTQMVKNAVIVPNGSKGGFITRKRFDDRARMGAEVTEQYRTLMRGLLDLTDNLVGGKVVPPPGVVRHDGDDPYLVVAADKGTAHLSDVANGVAEEYGFWLGDAFASGGSNGYDHKKEGITARGGWECVRRHFREMGKDIQAEPFTVAGIGDMSGDVFGNGMLLSKQIRLLAAFDHRHVFIDPDPDPAVSFAERQRLFNLPPGSSWEDYDRSRLSAGALIVPRGAKEVELTPEARRALGLPDEVTVLDGESLIRAVITAPVELLWNGGIGTYVKDREETHAEVGDPPNDPVRVNAEDLRCKVVGEGGNLGLTQRARIQFHLQGGRINTDALDNSAGVDMSDHEVNLKILLNRVVQDGGMTLEQRNDLLREMTDQVSTLVLHDNVSQSLAVSLDEMRSKESLDDFTALIQALERDRLLNREKEDIPDNDGLAERRSAGLGLSRPTLCVLLAHAKMFAKAQLLASKVPDDPATESYLVHYFPPRAVETAGTEGLRGHRLRREIVTTQLVNDLVDLMGSSFLHRISRDTGNAIPDVVRAWLVASRISGAPEIRADLAGLEGRYPSETIYRWLRGLARVLEATTAWLLANAPADGATDALIEDARGGLSALRGNFAKVVSGEDRALFLARLGELQDLGVERTLGERLITLRFLPQLLEIVEVARRAGTDELKAAKAFYTVSERFGTAALRERVRAAAGRDPWERRFAQALEDDVQRAQRGLVQAVLAHNGGEGKRALDAVEKENPRQVRTYRELFGEVRSGNCPLAAYALAVHQLRDVAASAQERAAAKSS